MTLRAEPRPILAIALDGLGGEETWIRFVAWMALGVVVYLVYGRRHSVLGRRLAAPPATLATEPEYVSTGARAEQASTDD